MVYSDLLSFHRSTWNPERREEEMNSFSVNPAPAQLLGSFGAQAVSLSQWPRRCLRCLFFGRLCFRHVCNPQEFTVSSFSDWDRFDRSANVVHLACPKARQRRTPARSASSPGLWTPALANFEALRSDKSNFSNVSNVSNVRLVRIRGLKKSPQLNGQRGPEDLPPEIPRSTVFTESV